MRKQIFKGKITNAVIENMNSWSHNGFHVYCGMPIQHWDEEGIEKLAQYIVRAPLSQERMAYIPEHETNDGNAKVIYKGKNSKTTQVFSALDWLARLITHIPNKGEQMVKYYGYYSNKSRGLRKKAENEEMINNESCNDTNEMDCDVIKLMFSNLKRKKFNKSWARLIQKVYNVNPLCCPKCGGKIRIISFIEDEPIIKKILKHLNMWMPESHDPPNHDPPKDMSDLIFKNQQIEMSIECHCLTSYDQTSSEHISQMPFEDEYSQLTPYEDYA